MFVIVLLVGVVLVVNRGLVELLVLMVGIEIGDGSALSLVIVEPESATTGDICDNK